MAIAGQDTRNKNGTATASSQGLYFFPSSPSAPSPVYPAGRKSKWQRKLKNCNYMEKNEIRTPPHTMWFRHSGMNNSATPRTAARQASLFLVFQSFP